MKKIWNGQVSGLSGSVFIIIDIIFNKISNYLFFLSHKGNLNQVGKGTYFYRNLSYRYPKSINLGDDCIINRDVNLVTELKDSTLTIGNNVSIAPNVTLDYTGNLTILDNVTISRGASIFTHDHGLDPRSVPEKKPLVIESNVWIGIHSTILQNVEYIGANSIIAAGSMITKNIEPNSIVGGNPAKLIRYIK